MKISVFHLAVLALSLSIGCAAEPADQTAALARVHFAGSRLLAGDTNAARQTAIFSLPVSQELLDHFYDRLSTGIYQSLTRATNVPLFGHRYLLKSLLPDVVGAEMCFELRGPANQMEWALAVQLEEPRAGVWRTNLTKLAAAWELGAVRELRLAGASGIECRKAGGPPVFRLARAGKWIVLGGAATEPKLLSELIEQIRQQGRPVAALTTNWLEIAADLPQLRPQLHHWLGNLSLPRVTLALNGKGEYLRSQARLHFSEPFAALEPWRISTNHIHDPVVSFTALRSIGPVLRGLPVLASLDLPQLPTQLCLWAQQNIPYETCFAAPLADAAKLMRSLTPKIAALIPTNTFWMPTEVTWATNRSEISWHGMPYVSPNLRAIEEAGTEFVLGGFFPPLTRTNAVAAELYAQFLGRPDVLYYDWEITQERLKQWREMYLLRSFFLMSSYSPTNAPSQKWLIALEPELGNTITEATLTSPNEVFVTRKSHLGFTGWELVTLMRWLDSTHFPRTFDPAPPYDREAARREHRKQAGATNAATGRPKIPLSTNAPGTKVRSLPGGAVPVPVPATEKKPPGTPAPPATPKQP